MTRLFRPNRRRFLQSAAALGAASYGGFSGALSGISAHAADTSGYKAIVCVFLLGGLDHYDTLIPYDQASYNRYAEIRAPLLSFYAASPAGPSRARNRLLPLAPDNAADFGGREFALPENLTGLSTLFQQGNAAIVGNVGPLIVPTTAAQFQDEAVSLPARLFSHNDQQSTWMSSRPEGAATGWGGRFVDPTLLGGGAQSDQFAAITTRGNELFLTGEQALAYQVSVGGATEIELLNFFEGVRSEPGGEDLFQSLRDQLTASTFSGSNLLEQDIAAAAENSIVTNASYNAAVADAAPLATPFPQTGLGQQLRTVAQTIAARNVLLTNRQAFLSAIGGFDTHANQVSDLPGLQTEIDGAVTAFYAAMVELGLENDVTLFTASDFGRTLFINGDGTDHGWGGHHFVVGGSVNGRRIFGEIPPVDFGHPQDAGGGRLVPTTAVEEFAAPLGRWFGLTEGEVAAALPNLSNFSAPPLDYI
ncbi:MAG: DUF1501 domain-containing protein [Pseudomonadota bacterium]